MDKSSETIEQYAVIEMLGHRVVAGRIQECKRFGAEGVLIDVPAVDGAAAWQTFVGGPSIYAATPCSREQALAYIRRNYQRPPEYLALPAPEPASKALPDTYDDADIQEVIEAAEAVVREWDYDAADPGPIANMAPAMVSLRQKLLALGFESERDTEGDPEPENRYPDDDEESWDDEDTD